MPHHERNLFSFITLQHALKKQILITWRPLTRAFKTFSTFYHTIPEERAKNGTSFVKSQNIKMALDRPNIKVKMFWWCHSLSNEVSLISNIFNFFSYRRVDFNRVLKIKGVSSFFRGGRNRHAVGRCSSSFESGWQDLLNKASLD